MKFFARWARKFGMARAVCTCCCSRWCRCASPTLDRLKSYGCAPSTFFRSCGRGADDRPVVIIDIDEASLKEDRAMAVAAHGHGRPGNRLNEFGAAVIGFDIVFPEPDHMSPGAVA